jgi:hypothetical protein
MSTIYERFTFTDDSFIILKETKIHHKTASGKCWSTIPASEEREIVTPKHYENFVSSVTWFNNYGYGSSCRAKWKYTNAGYLPFKISSISPYQEEKHVVTFEFINKSILENAAGYREMEIMKKAVCYERERFDRYNLIRFITNDPDWMYSGTFDLNSRQWVN